jgi:Holliday junction resolvase RusA-like endonuclease
VTRLAFTVPGSPRFKERARTVPGQSRPFTPKATVQAERAMLAAFRQAYPDHKPFTGPVRVTVIAVFSMPASWPKKLRDASGTIYHVSTPDLDNIEKLIDALNGEAFADDSQIAERVARKRYGSPARTDITIETLDQPDIPATPGQKRLEARVAATGTHRPQKASRGTPTKSKYSKATQARINAALVKDNR